MNQQLNLSSVMVVKRQPKKLPSIRRHFTRAIAIILCLGACAALTISVLSDPDDAKAEGAVGVEPPPLPPAPDTLEGDAGTLPDLLQGDVPPGVNPTERLDALGNPIGGPSGNSGQSRNPAPLDLSGDSNITVIRPPRRGISTGPQQIMIDGKPIDGGPVISARRSPLPAAPIAGLSRPSPFGPVPKPATDGRKPVKSYARPFQPISGRPTVSLIIGGLGVDNNITQRAITELPPEITLSFAAHTRGLQGWVNQARAAGHEVLIELPMESNDFNANEPGAKYTLKTDISAARNIRNLDWLMSRAQGYFAVTNYNGEKLITRSDVIAPILTHLADSGVGLIYDGSASAKTLPALSSSVNLPYTQAYTLIDTVTQPSAIDTEFRRLEAQASSGSKPIGVGFAYGATIDAVRIWAAELPGKNLQLAPASHSLSK